MAVALLPELGSLRVTGYATAVAAPMMLAAGTDRGSGNALPAPSIREAALIGYLTVAAASGGFLLIDRTVGRIGTARAGLFAGLVPVDAIGAGHRAATTRRAGQRDRRGGWSSDRCRRAHRVRRHWRARIRSAAALPPQKARPRTCGIPHPWDTGAMDALRAWELSLPTRDATCTYVLA